jgi:serine/threonine-protein kinase HipA
VTYTPVTVVEVLLWGKAAGAVALDPASGHYAFEYQPSFLRSGIELAPITMPLGGASAPFVFPDLPEVTYRRLPGLLADALPDDFGNALIDAWMAQQGVDTAAITPLDRLAYMGKRGMGALEFKPARGPRSTKSATALEMSALVESARRAVAGELDTDAHAEAALAQIIQVGTSAGARAKAVIAWIRDARGRAGRSTSNRDSSTGGDQIRQRRRRRAARPRARLWADQYFIT